MDALELLQSKIWLSISWHKLLSQFSHQCCKSHLFILPHSPNQVRFSRALVNGGIVLSEGKELISVTSGVRRSNPPNLCKSSCSLSPS